MGVPLVMPLIRDTHKLFWLLCADWYRIPQKYPLTVSPFPVLKNPCMRSACASFAWCLRVSASAVIIGGVDLGYFSISTQNNVLILLLLDIIQPFLNL